MAYCECIGALADSVAHEVARGASLGGLLHAAAMLLPPSLLALALAMLAMRLSERGGGRALSKASGREAESDGRGEDAIDGEAERREPCTRSNPHAHRHHHRHHHPHSPPPPTVTRPSSTS